MLCLQHVFIIEIIHEHERKLRKCKEVKEKYPEVLPLR